MRLVCVAGAGQAGQAGKAAGGEPQPRTGCGAEGVTRATPSERVITARQVAAVRDQLERWDLAAYIVPYSDEHQVREC